MFSRQSAILRSTAARQASRCPGRSVKYAPSTSPNFGFNLLPSGVRHSNLKSPMRASAACVGEKTAGAVASRRPDSMKLANDGRGLMGCLLLFIRAPEDVAGRRPASNSDDRRSFREHLVRQRMRDSLCQMTCAATGITHPDRSPRIPISPRAGGCAGSGRQTGTGARRCRSRASSRFRRHGRELPVSNPRRGKHRGSP